MTVFTEADHVRPNPYGVARIYKIADDHYSKGYKWLYKFQLNKKTFTCSASNLIRLKENVLRRGWPWIITDKELFKKTVEEEGLDWSLFE
ncbi:MAG: hypothetical protein K6A34_06285 [Methanobrevibacter sp.]|nr:hypothetical protein [Methanobrevibacter sp.]